MADLHIYLHSAGGGELVAGTTPALPSPLEAGVDVLETMVSNLVRELQLESLTVQGIQERQGMIYRLLERSEGKLENRQRRRKRSTPAYVLMIAVSATKGCIVLCPAPPPSAGRLPIA